MKHLRLLLVCIPFLSMSCSKSGGTTTTPPVTPPVTVVAEADIAFKLEADGKEIDYAAIYAALSATQPINVNVTSTPFPKDGVTIDISVKRDADNASVSTGNVSSSTAATNALSIANLAKGDLCTTTVTVTSKTLDPVSKTYKSLLKTFKIARK